jgi:acyl-CoA synthetase (AMP-forming)/AMP-acid ligase II
MLVLGDIVRLNARRYADKKAIVGDKESLTFEQLNNMANRIADGLLSTGLKPGDRVAIWSGNCIRFVPIIFAVWKCGAIIVPMNSRFKTKEAKYVLQNSEPAIIFHAEELAALTQETRGEYDGRVMPVSISGPALEGGKSLRDLAEGAPDRDVEIDVDPYSTAMVMYTSGTTGAPKGVIFSHFRELSDITDTALETDIKPEDVMLVNMPMFHNGGLSGSLMTALLRGCTCVIQGGSFDPDTFFSTIERFEVSVLNVVPTMLGKLVNHPRIADYNLSSLKKIFYGSSPISESILEAVLRLFKADFYQFYGQTESGMLLVLKPADHFTERSRFTGRALCRADVRVVDEDGRDQQVGGVGEIISRQKPLGMDGYYGMEEATKDTIRKGWIHTGDVARVERNGYFTIVDRLKDMIISGAENIYCKEIENVICEHPAVSEVAVFGIPDDIWGEAVCALVVPKQGHTLTEDEIINFCGTRLSGYKKPKRVEFRDGFPKNAAGKLVKKLLKEPYWTGKEKRI